MYFLANAPLGLEFDPMAFVENLPYMGIGMVVCVAEKDVEKTLASLKETGEDALVIGKTVAGKGVILK